MNGRTRAVAAAHVRLRWRLLRGAIRRGGADQVGGVLSTVASVVAGLGLATVAAAVGRTGSDPATFFVLFCTVVLFGALGFGVVAGIAQPIDPRVLAAEPLSDRERVAGLLAASALGPPGLAGIAVGAGLVVGALRGAGTAPAVVIAAAGWCLALLFVARTATNLLALLVNRFLRVGQLAVGLAGLVFYGAFQFVPALIGGLDDDARRRLADIFAWTPPGQIGRALGDPGRGAYLHAAAGCVWLPLLVWGFAASTTRLAVAVRRSGGLEVATGKRSLIGRAARWACGGGPVGALAWRGLVIRFRTPRTALETFTGAGVGLAAVLVPTLTRDTAGSGAVLVGGAVQLCVLFMSGNSFGSDGAAVTHELLSGIDPRDLVVAKARAIAIVASPLAIVGPVIAAAVTDEWRFFPAGVGVGVGALLAGTGAALVQSALVPIAIPESDNPFAGGETGKGIVAAALLGAVVVGLAVLTVPVALALIWAIDRGNTPVVTLLGALTVALGWLAARAGIAIATRRIAGREPEFVAAVTPAR